LNHTTLYESRARFRFALCAVRVRLGENGQSRWRWVTLHRPLPCVLRISGHKLVLGDWPASREVMRSNPMSTEVQFPARCTPNTHLLDNAKPPRLTKRERNLGQCLRVALNMEIRSCKLIEGKMSLAEDARGLLALGRVTWFDRRNPLLQLVSTRFICGQTIKHGKSTMAEYKIGTRFPDRWHEHGHRPGTT
jgi:hypothetical protein